MVKIWQANHSYLLSTRPSPRLQEHILCLRPRAGSNAKHEHVFCHHGSDESASCALASAYMHHHKNYPSKEPTPSTKSSIQPVLLKWGNPSRAKQTPRDTTQLCALTTHIPHRGESPIARCAALTFPPTCSREPVIVEVAGRKKAKKPLGRVLLKLDLQRGLLHAMHEPKSTCVHFKTMSFLWSCACAGSWFLSYTLCHHYALSKVCIHKICPCGRWWRSVVWSRPDICMSANQLVSSQLRFQLSSVWWEKGDKGGNLSCQAPSLLPCNVLVDLTCLQGRKQSQAWRQTPPPPPPKSRRRSRSPGLHCSCECIIANQHWTNVMITCEMPSIACMK